LDVDAIPAGYPVIQKFEPVIDTFEKEWLEGDVPDWR